MHSEFLLNSGQDMFVFAALWMPTSKEEALATHHHIINCTAAQHIHEKNIAAVESGPALLVLLFRKHQEGGGSNELNLQLSPGLGLTFQ